MHKHDIRVVAESVYGLPLLVNYLCLVLFPLPVSSFSSDCASLIFKVNLHGLESLSVKIFVGFFIRFCLLALAEVVEESFVA